jgi:hypothetical protein
LCIIVVLTRIGATCSTGQNQRRHPALAPERERDNASTFCA